MSCKFVIALDPAKLLLNTLFASHHYRTTPKVILAVVCCFFRSGSSFVAAFGCHITEILGLNHAHIIPTSQFYVLAPPMLVT